MRITAIVNTLVLIAGLLAAPLKASDYAHFTRPADALAPVTKIHGLLTLTVDGNKLNTRVLRDDRGITRSPYSWWDTLPEFSFAFAQYGDAIIPLTSGAIANDHPNWEWVLTPGEIWQTTAGIRASIPFALMEKNENCVHNGVILVDLESEAGPSRAELQIASETCLYLKFDMWGELDAVWRDAPNTDAHQLLTAYKFEQATSLPVKPVAELLSAYPLAMRDGLSEAGRISAEDMTHYGVLKDGIHYVGGCMTRMGSYPHCDQMVMPAYSFAKSLVAAFALMRLERLYPGSSQQKISDYVPECTTGNWQDVRFVDALNMMTGNFGSRDAGVDEGSAAYQTLFLARSHAEKIKFACEHFPHKSDPGTVFVYHSSDTYILGTALNAFWKQKTGADRDFFRDLIVDDIYAPLGLSASAKWIRRTYDHVAQPFTGWGLLLNRNDLAKLIWFLSGDNETLLPESVFPAELLQAALQTKDDDRRVVAGQAFRPDDKGLLKYNNGFWAYNIQEKLACERPAWIAFMSGYGGLSAAILPNQVAYYNVSDGGKHAFLNALLEINKITTLC